MEESLKEMREAAPPGLNVQLEFLNNNSTSSFNGASSPVKFAASRQAASSLSSDSETSPPRKAAPGVGKVASIVEEGHARSVHDLSVSRTRTRKPAAAELSTTPAKSKRFSFLRRKKKNHLTALAQPILAEPEVDLKPTATAVVGAPSPPLTHMANLDIPDDALLIKFNQPTTAAAAAAATTTNSNSDEVIGSTNKPSSSDTSSDPNIADAVSAPVPPIPAPKSLSNELDNELERASHDAQLAVLEAKVRIQVSFFFFFPLLLFFLLIFDGWFLWTHYAINASKLNEPTTPKYYTLL